MRNKVLLIIHKILNQKIKFRLVISLLLRFNIVLGESWLLHFGNRQGQVDGWSSALQVAIDGNGGLADGNFLWVILFLFCFTTRTVNSIPNSSIIQSVQFAISLWRIANLSNSYLSILFSSETSSTGNVGSVPDDESFRFMANFIRELQLVDDEA